MSDQNNLSAREIEILQLVATGLTNREIGQKLTISPNTVKVHLSNIFEKISVSSRTEATLYGIDHGLVEVPGGGEGVIVQPPGWAQELRKLAWLGIPLILLLAAFLVTFTFNVLVPPPSPEIQAMAELAERWQELAPMPVPRAGMAAAAYNGEIYAIAGEGPEGVSEAVFRYSPGTDTWVQLADKPTPVSDVHGALIGEKIYVPGGLGTDGRPTDVLEVYDPRQDVWTAGARLPVAVSAYALADFEGQLYLFGGWDGARMLDTVFVYDPQADAWEARTPMALARRDHGAVALDDRIVVLGGRNQAGALKDAVSYYPSRDANGEDPWEDFVDLPEERYGFGVANVFDAIYLMGGTGEEGAEGPLTLNQVNESTWQPFLLDTQKKSINQILIPIHPQIYIFSFVEEEMVTELSAYRAYYYEIFIPLIR
jgi:DNA-binding CsgD family transcriptional regulator